MFLNLKEMLIRQHEINTLLHKAYIVAMNVFLLFQEITEISTLLIHFLYWKEKRLVFGTSGSRALAGQPPLPALTVFLVSRAATVAGSDRLFIS